MCSRNYAHTDHAVEVARPPHPQLFRSMLEDKPALYFPVKVAHPAITIYQGFPLQAQRWQ